MLQLRCSYAVLIILYAMVSFNCSVAHSRRKTAASSSSMTLSCWQPLDGKALLGGTHSVCKCARGSSLQSLVWTCSAYDITCTVCCASPSPQSRAQDFLGMRYKLLWQAPISVCNLSQVQPSPSPRRRRSGGTVQMDQLQQDMATLAKIKELSQQLRVERQVHHLHAHTA